MLGNLDSSPELRARLSSERPFERRWTFSEGNRLAIEDEFTPRRKITASLRYYAIGFREVREMNVRDLSLQLAVIWHSARIAGNRRRCALERCCFDLPTGHRAAPIVILDSSGCRQEPRGILTLRTALCKWARRDSRKHYTYE